MSGLSFLSTEMKVDLPKLLEELNFFLEHLMHSWRAALGLGAAGPLCPLLPWKGDVCSPGVARRWRLPSLLLAEVRGLMD